MKHTEEKKESSLKSSLNLPQTDFPMRAYFSTDDPLLLKRWADENLWHKTFVAHKGKSVHYILHDGPPYANGNIHLGHAYNKILKDIIAKSQRMMGKYVPVTPGWDCHGLPIEFRVSQDNPTLSKQELKKACRAYAQEWINVQKEEFKALGVCMDWDNPYLTMSSTYESAIITVFGLFYSAGYIVRKNKTVPWCITCKTVLASAEIEYHDRKDPSIYVLFPLVITDALKELLSIGAAPVYILVWTTTPWTLTINRAVLIKPETTYVMLLIQGMYVIVGEACADALCTLLGITKEIVTVISSEELIAATSHAYHLFDPNRTIPLIVDSSVNSNEGTAFVQCAPGAGPEDYEVGIKNNLEIFSPVGIDGVFTNAVIPEALQGMSILDAQGWVIKELQSREKLLFKGSLRHSYPHCWRCRNGLIFRATKQWFCDLAQHDLKEKTLAALPGITTIPENSMNRLRTTIDGRLEWCLSRQRVWGVPIPSLLCITCDTACTSEELINYIAQETEKHGIEWWDTIAVENLTSKINGCSTCGLNTTFKKETDILDVWFDAGISHYAVLKKNPFLSFPADMYLEGKDQHRGWFQSSLLTSMVVNGTPPMRTIITHGYTVDEQGKKMSKSLGNGITPQEIISKVGTDGLRLWVASVDYSGEIVYSAKVIAHVQEVHRKIRNTCRFLLSNLYDFDPTTEAIAYDQLLPLDHHALVSLFSFNHRVLRAYAQYDTAAVFHLLGDYCVVELSSFYLDIIKDRLYTEQPSGFARKSAQTVCALILDVLIRLMAPILSFTAEQLADFAHPILYPKEGKKESIHLSTFMCLDEVWRKVVQQYVVDDVKNEVNQVLSDTTCPIGAFANLSAIPLAAEYTAMWDRLLAVRDVLLRAIEVERARGAIKHSLEARLDISIDPQKKISTELGNFFTLLAKHNSSAELFFKEFLIVSQVHCAQEKGAHPSSIDGLSVVVTQALGTKCPRCWQWEVASEESGLCSRCTPIVNQSRTE